MKYSIKSGARVECEIYITSDSGKFGFDIPHTVVEDWISDKIVFEEIQYIKKFLIDYDEYCMIFRNKDNMYAVDGCHEHILVHERDVTVIAE